MSYCRWSSDNFKCDIYAYYSVDDCYTIHVASNRIIGEIPEVDRALITKRDKKSVKEYLKQDMIRSKFLDNCERKPIGLPFDGESFDCDTLGDFYNKMIELRNMGYSFPDYVLEEIKEEIFDAQ